MRTKFFAAVIFTLALGFVSCDKDNDGGVKYEEVQEWPSHAGKIVNGVITDEPTYQSRPRVTINPWKCMQSKFAYVDNSTARLTIEVAKSLELSTIPYCPFRGTIPVPGILPGSSTMSVDVTIDETSENDKVFSYPIVMQTYVGNPYKLKNILFHGSGENDMLKFECNGQLNEAGKIGLSINVTEYKTVKKGYEGNWQVNKFKWENNRAVESSFITKWETSGMPAEMNGVLSAAEFLQLVLNVPFLPRQSFGLSSRGTSSFRDILYYLGNIITISQNDLNLYYQVIEGVHNPNKALYKSFAANTITYIPKGSGELSVYVNPVGIFAMSPNSSYTDITGFGQLSTPPDLYGLFSQILSALSPDYANGGLDSSISTDGEKLKLSITDDKRCVDMLRKAVLPLLKNEVYRYRLLSYVKDTEEMSHLYTAVNAGIESFSKMLDGTGEIELGISASAVNINEILK